MTHHRKTASLVSPQWPRHALGHACLLALASFSTMAVAQQQPVGAALRVTNATVDPVIQTTGSVWSADYGLTSSSSQFGDAVLDASNNGIVAGSSLMGGGTVPTAVSENSLQSLAFGNTSLSTGGLSLLSNTGSTGGLLVVNLQSLSGTVDGAATPATVIPLSVSAVVEDSSTVITQSGMGSADLTLNTNTLQASTQLNVSDIQVQGVLPAGYVSTATGSSAVAFGSTGASMGNPAATPTPVAGTTGSVNLSSLQSTASANPSATLSNSNVALAVSDTTGGTFSSAASVNGNTLAASTGTNTATSVFRAETGSAAWNGSVSVTNLQNAAAVDGTTESLASVADSSISADLRNGVGQTDLTGALTLSDNQITATATGNAAGTRLASGAIAAGTAIVFEGSSDVTGTGSGTGTSVNLAASTARSVADLTLVNAQSNTAGSFLASVEGAGVTSAVDNLDGGALTQSGNTLKASATANLGGNLVSVGQTGSVSNISASVAALTLQSNRTVSSTASLTDSAVSAVVGVANAVPTGTVTLNENTLAATAEGNVGVTSVGLQAANLAVSGTLGVGATPGVNIVAATGTASAGLGMVALSVQSNEGVGGSLTTNNEGGSVSLSFNDQGAVPDALAIQSTTATLSGNLLQASATANSASTDVNLSGTNGTGLSAAVGNSQRNLDMAVTANAGSVTPLSAGLTAGAVNSSALTLDSNRITAAATGNTASSRLEVSLANASGAGSLTPFPRADVWGASEVNAEADLALANAQLSSRADITAAVAGSVSLDVGNVSSALSRSTLSLSSNAVGATVEVNRAANTMALEVGNLSGMDTALASLQAMSVGNAVSSTDGGVTLSAGSVAGSALTASSNTVSASTQGNAVANNVRLSGTTATGDQFFMGSGYSYAQSSSANTNANVSLANGQSSTGNTLSALVGNADPAAVTLTVDAVTAGAALSLADNRLGASTSVNSASNALALDITNITDMTAAVASGQELNGTSATAVMAGLVSADTGSVLGSNITVSGNAIAASVSGNSVNNAVSVDAATASAQNFGGFSSANSYSFGSNAQGALQMSNYQQVMGTGSADLSSISTGDVKITSGMAPVGSSALTLSNNSVLADTRANSASNALELNVTTLSATAGLASSQRIDFAQVGSLSTGNVLVESGGVTGSALSVSGNSVKSAALGNLVNNRVELAGTNATGASSGGVSSAVAGQNAVMQADAMVANLQNSNGIALSALTTGAVGMTVDGVNSSTALTLSGNALGALTQSNSASNTLSLDATNLSAYSAGVASSQATNGAVSAIATAQGAGAFTVTAGSAVNSPVVLSDNTFSAVAGMNEAFNTLTANGATLSGQSGAATSAVGNSFTDGFAFTVVNAQSGMGTVNAVADPVSVGFAGALTGGSLSITGNTVLARASVNTASNELTLDAMNSLQATAVVNNLQEMTSSASALVATSGLGADLGLVMGGASTVAVSGNSVTAQSTGNLAANVLNATAVTGISSSGPATQPTFAVLNQQRTQATPDGISAVLNGTTLGASLNGMGGSTTVQGNQLVAMAQGNSVDNVIGMSALPGSLNTARAAITNVQYNMASISASVSGASVMGSGSVNGAGSVNVSGNTITAQVMGNRAVNSITAR